MDLHRFIQKSLCPSLVETDPPSDQEQRQKQSNQPSDRGKVCVGW
jgi:hypothetical protein